MNDDNFYEKTDLLANVALNYLEKNCVLKYCDMYEDFESFSKNIYTDIKLMNSILPQKVFMQYSNLNDADKLNIYYEKKVYFISSTSLCYFCVFDIFCKYYGMPRKKCME